MNSVIPFCKVAHPDIEIPKSSSNLEKLNKKDRKVCRTKLLNDISRSLNSNLYSCQTIYDLDNLIAKKSKLESYQYALRNNDKFIINQKRKILTHLQFESRFESGNLRKAMQVCKYKSEEYFYKIQFSELANIFESKKIFFLYYTFRKFFTRMINY